MEKPEPQIDAIGLEDHDLTITFADGAKGTYSPSELLDLASEHERLEFPKDSSAQAVGPVIDDASVFP